MGCEFSNIALRKKYVYLISKFCLLSFQIAGMIVENFLKCIQN